MPIGATIYKMGIDTSQFAAGSALTRAELRMTKQILKETATETEKYGAAVARLDNLVSKGAITHEQQNKVLSQVRQEQLRGIPVVGNYVSGLYAMGPAAAAAAAATAGLAFAVVNLNDSFQKTDALITSAQTLGIAAGELERLQTAADFADISAGRFATGMQAMEVAVAKAAAGMLEVVKGFDLIQLDAKKLMDLRPEQAFLQIVDALQNVDNAFVRARAASVIFGGADFARINTDDIARATKNLEAMGGVIQKDGIDKFNELDNAIKDVEQSSAKAWQNLLISTAPMRTMWSEIKTGSIQALADINLFNLSLEDTFNFRTKFSPPIKQMETEKLDKGGSAIKDIVEEVSEEETKAETDAHHRKQQLAMARLKSEMETRERNTEAEFKKREEMERDIAKTREILWDEGVKEFVEGHRKMLHDMAEAEKEEDRAREIVADMEEDLVQRARQIQEGRTTVGIRQGSREALEAVTRANRAPTVVSAPEMTKAQREAVELLKTIAAKEPIMVVEEAL